MKGVLKKQAFLDWYFADYSERKDLGLEIVKDLLLNPNKDIIVSTESIFQRTGYIPASICENQNNFPECHEFENPQEEVTLID